MKLLVQGDDFGFTRAVTDGIVDSIDFGMLRNTGLFTNMPSAEYAVSFMKDRPQVCFGIDFNLVSGPSVCDPKEIPHLVDAEGEFIRSGTRIEDPMFQSEEGRRKLFPYAEVEKEMKAQYERFITLTGRKPGYLHAHSLMHENYMDVLRKISADTGIPFSMDIIHKINAATMLGKMSNKKEFNPEAQLNKDTLVQFMECEDTYLSSEYGWICCHPGYIDAELLGLTTLSLERCRDAEMYMSVQFRNWIKEHNVELITYCDLY